MLENRLNLQQIKILKNLADDLPFILGLDVPEIRFWYNTEKAKKHLGFSPKFSLQNVMRQYYENKGLDKSL
jgi:hypothetical protein